MEKKWTANFKKNFDKFLDGVKQAVPTAKEKTLDAISGMQDLYGCYKNEDTYKEIAKLKGKDCTWTNLLKFAYAKKSVTPEPNILDKAILSKISSDNICTLKDPSEEVCSYFSEETQKYFTTLVENCGVSQEEIS